MAIYKLRENIKLNNNFKKDSSIDYLELSGIDNFDTRHLTIDEFPSRAKWIIDKNTIIIGRVRPLNKNHNKYMKDSILIGSSGFTCFKSTDVNVLNDYLWYVLQKENFTNYTSDHAKGSAYPEISQSDLLNFKFYAPKISEQQKIIDIIKPIEDGIATLESIIKKQKNIFKLNNSSKKISDFAKNINTGYSYSQNDKSENGKYNIYTIKNISGSEKYDKTNIIRNNKMEIGDVITGMSGTIGTATVISDNNLVSNQRTLSFKTKYPAQIAFAIEAQKVNLDNYATGAVQKNIKKEDILNLNFEPNYENSFDNIYINSILLKNKLITIKSNILNLLIK